MRGLPIPDHFRNKFRKVMGKKKINTNAIGVEIMTVCSLSHISHALTAIIWVLKRVAI